MRCANLFCRIECKKFNSHKIFMYTSLQEKHVYMQRSVRECFIAWVYTFFQKEGKAQTTYLHYHFQAHCMKNRADMLKQRSWVTLVSKDTEYQQPTQLSLDLGIKGVSSIQKVGKGQRERSFGSFLVYIVLATQSESASQLDCVYIVAWLGVSCLPRRLSVTILYNQYNQKQLKVFIF